MNLLQKVYNTIKEKIEFAFFKRKFDSWYEVKDIENTEYIKNAKDYIFKKLAEEDFNAAFWKYCTLQDTLKNIEQLKSFKQYVLNNENDEH